MGKIIKLALFLAVVAGISGAALSAVYDVTNPIIQEAKIAAEKENLVKIYASATFEAKETDLSEYKAIASVYDYLNAFSFVTILIIDIPRTRNSYNISSTQML